MSNERRTSALWVTMLQASLLGVVAGLTGYVLLTTVIQAPARAQGPGPGGFQGPPPMGLLAFRAANGKSSRSSTRTATSAWTAPNARRRASGSPPSLVRAASAGVAAVLEVSGEAA